MLRERRFDHVSSEVRKKKKAWSAWKSWLIFGQTRCIKQVGFRILRVLDWCFFTL